MNDKIRFLITMFLFNKKQKYIVYGIKYIKADLLQYFIKVYNRKDHCCKGFSFFVTQDIRETWYREIINK